MKPISVKPAMSVQATAQIREDILKGRLAPGMRIRQEALAATLGVSREPIRHALLMLEREGLVQVVPQRGAIVAPLKRSLIVDIYDLREALEPFVTAKLAERIGFDVRPLRQLVKEGRKAVREGTISTLIDLDLKFHTLIYRSLENRVITQIMEVQFGHLRRAVHSILTVLSYRKKAWDEHEAIVDAVACNNLQDAASRARSHVRDARDLLSREFLPESSAIPGDKESRR